jgi:glycosyltransferase involved in cell wall biosynthesis
MKLSVIIPVYNEENTIEKIAEAVNAVPVPKEIIIVDDGSTDRTRQIIQERLANRQPFKIILHERNRGKGQAVRTGIAAAAGQAVIIQDADLEYDPRDYLPMLEALEKGAGVVYGSRFLGKRRVTAWWHRGVNRFLTALANGLFSADLTDMETCYKLFRADLLKGVEIRSHSFEVEVELTAKMLKKGERIVEVPISYKGRAYHDGKKIGWRDFFRALAALVRYRFFEK